MPKPSCFIAHPDPSIRLLALRELSGRAEGDPAVLTARAELAVSPAVSSVLAGMHPDGYWIQRNPRTGAEVGSGVEYGAYASTHYRLSYLAELGLDRTDPRVALAAERYLGLQAGDGDFWLHMSCLLGINLRTFAKLGYGEDPRVRKALGLLLATERPDGGYLCDQHERPEVGKSGRALKRPKSCYRGSLKALLAFSYFPELAKEARQGSLASYFLGRGGIYRSARPEELVHGELLLPSFPITWGADIVQVLYALSRLGLGSDPRLERAWRELDALRDSEGFVRLAWTPVQSPWKVGRRGSRSDWLTLYADIAAASR